MASEMANGTNAQNTRSGRLGNLTQKSAFGSGEQRSSNASSMGQGLGSSKNGWNTNIWSNTSFGSGFTEKFPESNRAKDGHDRLAPVELSLEGKKGSGSLLSSSESDGWAGRQVLPWNTSLNQYPAFPSKNQSTSPIRHRNSDQSAPSSLQKDGLRNTSPYYSTIGQVTGPSPSKSILHTSSTSLQPAAPSFESIHQKRIGDESRRQFNMTSTGGTTMPSHLQTARGVFADDIQFLPQENGLSPSVNGSLSSSRSGLGIDSATPLTLSSNGTSAFSHHPRASASLAIGRPSHSSHPSFHSERQAYSEIEDDGQDRDVSVQFGRLHLGGEDLNYHIQGSLHRSQYASYTSYEPSLARNGFHVSAEGFEDLGSYTPEGIPEAGFLPQFNAYRPSFGDRSSTSPGNGDYRRGGVSPHYSTGATPPVDIRSAPGNGSGLSSRAGVGQAALLDRKLSRVQQEQQGYLVAPPGALQPRLPYNPHPYAYQPYGNVRFNPLAPYYSIPQYPGIGNNQIAPRGPSREQEQANVNRSPLLEEFRSNSKSTKRYELKDIYNHVVEFSGDQHGSRFIQQKLETANSDEKEQVFAEIQSNSIQLMTDVFGNYVIQKLFEHGNQSQKKALASQMKGHMLALSLQMYGCRVVQKALEHILTDQQATLVKELENHVLKCVKDQNGNHVIQKAIERVPAEHIQFIIKAFTDQVQRLATHPYGCRVIQRMLEHCEESSRLSILAELHACAQSLIMDQYGNYVTQHVIQQGEERDRSRIVSIVISQLLVFSKHKFASNVVEKSIEFGNESQKAEIFKILTTTNDRGESPLSALMRDQYGNYVIQKMLNQLKGAEREYFVDQIQAHLGQLKKFSYGKQVAAIEKMIYDANVPLKPTSSLHQSLPDLDTSAATTPPLLTGDTQSPQSSSLPSTSNSTVEGPVEPGMKATAFPTELKITTSE